MKKSLLIDARFWGPSHTGLGRYSKSLVQALENLHPNIDITLLVNKKTKTSFKTILVKAKPYSIREQIEIPQVISNLKPDLSHFLHFNVPLKVRSPFLVTIHDLIKHHSTGKDTTTRSMLTYPIKRLAYFQTIKHALNHSIRVLTPSNWVKKDILTHYSIPASKITVTPEAVDLTYLKTKPNQTRPLTQPYLIYVGNAYPHKNLIQLIKAIKKTSLKLIIVTGRDIFYQRLRKQIKSLEAQPKVKIKGFTSDQDLKNLYFHSVGFITTSLFEGFGLPGLEALASGTLVLASKRASMPEVYQDKAIYFNPDNLSEIVKQINMASSLSPAKRQLKIQAGLKHAQQFSWAQTAEKTIKAYQDILE
jgi:glycosyltransferase involved in cell wall biosynthesis